MICCENIISLSFSRHKRNLNKLKVQNLNKPNVQNHKNIDQHVANPIYTSKNCH